MSFYLAIVGTKDNAVYSLDFGTYRQGGDGTSKVHAPTTLREVVGFLLIDSG
ncbi:hypothetical protein BZA70DRAFT_272826 [Myxozyma melibiosi]|uniref:Uncharacterized protein n=1 Tax=Myxozyma melibiosi TaxID=54550 RepID=A0ABR1FDY3_9ASCO